MSSRPVSNQPFLAGGLPRPGKALGAVMIALLAIWIAFAVGINWGGAGNTVFQWLAGSTESVLHGQVWRLLTAPLLHLPSGDGAVGHIVTTLLGLYFLAPSLEKKWGGGRMIAFLYGAAISGFVFQMLAELLIPLVLPGTVAMRASNALWFGAVSAVEAVAIAWALSFRGQQVMLMFVLPVSSTILVVFVVGMSVLRLIASGTTPEGLFSPFGAMLFGWLVGGGESAPLRRWWLQRKLKHVQAQKRAIARAGAPKLRVIEGSRKSEPEPPDKRWLN
jgi:membrane associated rhomboid family serine protease